MPSTLATLSSGAIFGAALTTAGVYSPSIIIGQLRFANFHMLEVFLTATAGSALVMATARKASYAPCGTRKPAALAGFTYGANILGGLMQGFGMALSGACAGTVLVQVAAGVSSSAAVLSGAILGGTAFARWGSAFKSAPALSSGSKDTVHESAGLQERYAIVLFDALCILVAVSAYALLPSRAGVNPFTAGLLIAGAQAASVLLTTNTLGVSTAYEQVGQWIWRTLESVAGSSKASQWPNTSSIAFGAGIVGGSVLLQKLTGVAVAREAVSVSTQRAVLGGFLLGFGSRVSGGCTSGHGISGMATLSKSSFITVAGMFGGGMGLAYFLY